VSQVLINKYRTDLANLRKVSGTHRESVVREAFKDLLKGWGRTLDLTFIPEYEFDTKTKGQATADSPWPAGNTTDCGADRGVYVRQ
jgi:hypothetical protein